MCVALFASPVSAQETVPVVLSYSAPSSCPPQGRFVARLRMHTQRLELSNALDALTLDVSIARTSRGFSGTLEVAHSGRAAGTRTFEATECAEVVWALALSAALSIDPEATVTVAAEAEGGGDTASDGPASSESTPTSEPARSSEADSEPQASPSGTDSAGGVTEPVNPPSEPVPEHGRAGVQWSLGPMLAASFAFDPKAALGGGLIVGVRDKSGRGLLPLELALQVEYLGTRATRGSDPLILDWWSANLLACPLRGGDSLTVLLCGAARGGLIQAQGVDVEEAETVSRGFFSLGLGLWARQRLSDHWELSGVADFQVPLVDRAFAVGPDLEVVSSSRPIGVSFALGAVYGF
jgi:hypothetical protein